MTNRLKWSAIAILSVVLLIGSLPPVQIGVANAQDESGHRATDTMIIIDNSGSMYGDDGNDPEQLRVIGADIFIARLGFGEPNESEYQAGVISMGSEPELVSPLQPIAKMRGSLARLIANPENAGGTHIIHALEMAYDELRNSPNRRPTNLPVVVLLTDGVPDPPEGQSQADIEKLVSENPDIPLFVMLLQNRAGGSSPEYQSYVEFWKQLQSRHTHVFAYQVEDAGQLEKTYNEIVAVLENTIPSEEVLLHPGDTYEVYISKYVMKLIVTAVHGGDEPGEITITDPSGTTVMDGEPGVKHFKNPHNPVEVISIDRRRIGDLVDDIWTIESDREVYIHLDRKGAYSIRFNQPEVSLTDINNVYLAIERFSPTENLVIKFSLMDKDGHLVTEPQPIYGKVIHPDGSEAELRIPNDIEPDSAGDYMIEYDYSTYPTAMSENGRYTFIINAGMASGESESEMRIPIAKAKLLVDVNRSIYIHSVDPLPVLCRAGEAAEITVSLGDVYIADMETVHVRVFGSGTDVSLKRAGEDTFSGDVSALCAPLLSGMECSMARDTTFKVRVVAQSPTGETLHPAEKTVQVQVYAPECTPTPPPPPTPTPTPTPTPIPDSDGDGWNDLEDQCVDSPGVEQFRGCPIPWWIWLLGGLVTVGVLAFIVLFLVPWTLVRISPPPQGYVMIEHNGKPEGIKSVRDAGIDRRTRKVTIGGDRKRDTIYVGGLKKREFAVEKQGQRVVLVDNKGRRKGTFDERLPRVIRTSDPEIQLKICLDRQKLR